MSESNDGRGLASLLSLCSARSEHQLPHPNAPRLVSQFRAKRSLFSAFRFVHQGTQKTTDPGRVAGAGQGCSGGAAFYWVGKSSCVKPVVFTSRKRGVRGGNREGVRNSVSKL
jgi:hypothetical protein